MHRWGLVTTIGGLSTVLALAGISTPANAADPVHSITVSKDESVVVVDGLTAGDEVRVELTRNDIEIGSALGVTPLNGVFELNHKLVTAEPVVDPPVGDGEAEENDSGPAVCWTGSTPEILGGDVVHVISGDVEEEVVVTDIDVTQEPTKVDANTGIVRGRVAGPVPPISQLSVTTKGRTASDQRFDGLAPGSSDGVSGKLEYTSAGRFTATFDGLSPAQMGAFLDSSDVLATHVSADTGTVSHSTVATYGADARFIEDLCPPVARRAVTGTSLGEINRANVDRRLTIWGVSADASAVQVGVEDRNGDGHTWPATIAGAGSAQTWSVTYPAGSLRGLADGRLTFSARYAGDAGVLAGVERTIHKDTTAPAGPRIRPQGGTFLGSRTIRLRSPGAREIWYTLNGTRPRPNRAAEYQGAFTLTRTATLRAIAFDRAGNASPVTTAKFLRAGAPAAPLIVAASSGSPDGLSSASARWRPRARTGGMRITGFEVIALRLNDGQVVNRRIFRRPAAARSFTAQLIPGQFRFQVRTITRAGRSAPSAVSAVVTAR
jgi:Chitobiase/beta-hexosaminidase C-terminal domain